MAAKTEAQEEFDSIFTKNQPRPTRHRDDSDSDQGDSDLDEEEQYRQSQIDAAMRMPVFDRTAAFSLPDQSFDEGRATGVKGVIADARSFHEARKSGSWRQRLGDRTSRLFTGSVPVAKISDEEDAKDSDISEDDEFMERWRENRRQEIEKGSDIRTRRTSPSVRRWGRLDEVDALGYLDAIEKVGREVTVVVFVNDPECEVSSTIEQALLPIVSAYPAIHFVKVNYEDIEFDNAGVPAILGYRNQGDLFANLTYIIDQISDDTPFGTHALAEILKKHQIL